MHTIIHYPFFLKNEITVTVKQKCSVQCFLQVVESMAADDEDWLLVQGRLEEIGPYTHYVQNVTFGAELIATITITHCNTSER